MFSVCSLAKYMNILLFELGAVCQKCEIANVDTHTYTHFLGTLYLLSSSKYIIVGRNLISSIKKWNETKWKYLTTNLYFRDSYLRQMRNRN